MTTSFRTIRVCLCCVLCAVAAYAEDYTVVSPDRNVVVKIASTDGSLSYSLHWKGQAIIEPSNVSLIEGAQYTVVSSETRTLDSTWKPVWGQFSEIRDHCREITLRMSASGIKLDLISRVYNDGFGLRFVVPEQQGITGKKVDFRCDHKLKSDTAMYFQVGVRQFEGPVSIRDFSADAARGGSGKKRTWPDLVQLPLLLDNGKGVSISIQESDLYTARPFEAALAAAAPDKQILRSTAPAAMSGGGVMTAWRVMLVGTQPGALVTSTTPMNLAAPCKIEDTSWIKAGKCLWDWRVRGYKTGDFVYKSDTASLKRFIDFAAANDIPYVLIDWRVIYIKGGRVEPIAEVDLKALVAYGRSKGVALIFYYDRTHGNVPAPTVFKLYSEFGAAGVKYGFMGNRAGWTREAIEGAAQKKLLIDFHDSPCPMTGVSRTLPNAVTREFCHAQQDARRAFTPRDFLKMAFVNALAGPLDMNNGSYGLNGINRGERVAGPRQAESYNSTVVSETARVLAIFSGLVILPDAPEEYAKKADLFEFIREMPGTWDESRVVDSEVGERIITARRSGDQWFVGSVVNEEGGQLKIPLDFLAEGVEYTVTYYEDSPESHYINNRESYRIRKGKVTCKDTVSAVLAPGGGHCMWIRPQR